MRRSLLLSLLLFLCAVPFVRAAMPGPGMPVPAPVVEVGEVLAVQDTQSRRYTGRVVSPATVSLVPRVAGEILEVGFRDGDTVQAGQMLYRIDPVRYEAAVKNARGDSWRNNRGDKSGITRDEPGHTGKTLCNFIAWDENRRGGKSLPFSSLLDGVRVWPESLFRLSTHHGSGSVGGVLPHLGKPTVGPLAVVFFHR